MSRFLDETGLAQVAGHVNKKASIFYGSQTEWDELTTEEKKAYDYAAFEDGGGSITAATVSYDNTESGLESTNVQGAIDEVNGKVTSKMSVVSSMPANPSVGDTVLYVGTVSGDFKPGHNYVYRESMDHYAMCLRLQVASGVYKYYDGSMQEISDPVSPTQLLSGSTIRVNGVDYYDPQFDTNGDFCYKNDENDKYYKVTGINFTAWPIVENLYSIGSETTATEAAFNLFPAIYQYLESTGPGWEDITNAAEVNDWEDASNMFEIPSTLAKFAFNITSPQLLITKIGKMAYLEGELNISKTEGSDQVALLYRAKSNLPAKYQPKRSGPVLESFGCGEINDIDSDTGRASPISVSCINNTGEQEWESSPLFMMTGFDAPPVEVTTSSKTFIISAHWRTEI